MKIIDYCCTENKKKKKQLSGKYKVLSKQQSEYDSEIIKKNIKKINESLKNINDDLRAFNLQKEMLVIGEKPELIRYNELSCYGLNNIKSIKKTINLLTTE